MALTIGSQLGSHEITALLGKGGMGEVYRARDLKLKREVAIKILPEEFARDPDRVVRFQREAEALAALNHPNIGAIYDIQEANESRFLVLELVEGETLADRVRRGPIPVEEALKIAQLIAEALEAAHEKGIVHRDLKPANVKLTPDDKVKVLDFGLAKAMESTTASATLSNSPTLSMAATQAGVILGTAAYMSPEQAKGFPADARSDVFSFGCVLYEMLTGRQAFQGEAAAEILASVLVREPDFSNLPHNLNPRLHDVLRRCLEKSPKRRWHAVADLRAELETIATSPRTQVIEAMMVAKPQAHWKRAIPIAITAILVAGFGSIVTRFWNRPVPGAVVKYPLVLPDDQAFTAIAQQNIAISRDGAQLAYIANNQVFLRSMSEMDARSITGDSSASPGLVPPLPVNTGLALPLFSPDRKWVGFFSFTDKTLKKIPVTGGTAVPICKIDAPYGADWYGDQIVYDQGNKGIFRVSDSGGNPELIVKPADANEFLDSPQLLNDGNDILFAATSEVGPDRWEKGQIVIQSLKSGERKIVLRGGSAPHYVQTGHLVYAVSGTLFAIPFDPKAGAIRGGPVPVIEGVLRGVGSAYTNGGTAQYAIADNGTIVYEFGSTATSSGVIRENLFGTPSVMLALVDRNGKVQPLELPAQPYRYPRLSPDGSQLAIATDDGKEANIWIYDLKSHSQIRQLTFGGRNLFPIWTPDGRYVTFQSDREGDRAIFKQLADGSGSAERLTKPEAGTEHEPEAWSRDGQMLTVNVIRGGKQSTFIWRLADGKLVPFNNAPPALQKHSAFSPDGKWIAYTSSEQGNFAGFAQVFVQPFPATGEKHKVSSDTGRTPVWSADGKEIFYHDVRTDQILVVDVRTSPTFNSGKATPLPIEGTIHPATQRNYDITPDGKQLVVVLPSSGARNNSTRRPPQQINVVLNWFTELQQRVPVR